MLRALKLWFAAMLAVSLPAMLQAMADEPVVTLGEGSYAAAIPAGAKGPPLEIFKTANVRGPMPTNDWWSSLAWMKFSERQYPHPLAVQAEEGGLRVYYPGANITANKAAIFGFMPEKGDLTLGHSAVDRFPDARVDGFSDWFVTAAFADGTKTLKTTYGHGSPFVYAVLSGGQAKIAFGKRPKIFAGDAKTATVGVSIDDRHYGLFGPRGATWSGMDAAQWICNAAGKPYFSLCVLPDDKPETLALFAKHAHAHVVDSRVSWEYSPKTGTVVTRFEVTTKPYEGVQRDTLMGLYPHQWRNLADGKPLALGYRSVRGAMKLLSGKTFATEVGFPGVLPSLPRVEGMAAQAVLPLLRADLKDADAPLKDTYWEGKHLGKLASIGPIAEEFGDEKAAEQVQQTLEKRLTGWLTAQDGKGVKRQGLFAYDKNWGTLIGYPASFGSEADLNDHHFHYGYFIKAAAEIARRNPQWAAEDRFGGMVKLLVDDIACPRRDDAQFPFLRNFDPYAGHSWASGNAKFGDGNNNESSSEAMNAWCGVILFGEAVGDRALRDLGIYLYTTEMTAIEQYWFDVQGENFPKDYPASVVTMVWGGKGANGTWFSGEPEAIHGINFLPITGGSLYLGRYPDYVRKNYEAMVREKGDAKWRQWADILLMFHALDNAEDALVQYEALPANFPAEGGNAGANTWLWLYALKQLGQVDRAVTADYPLYAVFRGKGGERTYCVYNVTGKPLTVRFSDGTTLQAKGKGFLTQRAKRTRA